VRKVAPHKVSVLLQGETGTGKEVLATLIHELSPRAQAPLVIQDCGVLTDTLLESELFGHVKGSFTGAVADKPGLFVVADGGTIFLDEIENTTPDLQAKLLRILEDGRVRPVGGTKPAHVDVRVVAASNRPLAQEVAAGRFRADLFYRLNTFPVRVPPLRERVEDILPLAEHFLMAANAKLGQRAPGFTEEARRALCAHAWPGNIRELRNAIECAVLLCEGRPIGVELLPEALRAPAPEKAAAGSLRERVRDYERELIREALAASGGGLRRAARKLQASVVTLRRKAIEYGLTTPMAGARRPVTEGETGRR
jgi:transcriptional regulator with PAS, ATPase and Fis domain